MAGFTDLDKLAIKDLLGPRFAEISTLLAPFIAFPEGESIDDLTGSEIDQIVEALKEVNKSFLILAGLQLAKLAPEMKKEM